MRKKLIKTFGFIILSNVSLMTMATSSSTTSSSETSILQINQTFKTKLRTKFVNSWVTETKEVSNSNIKKGQGGTIFEDSQGNLWSMGTRTPLQKYNYISKKWGNSSGNNINDGYEGVIFEDSQGNLWASGNGTPLQKYDYNINRWKIVGGSNKINDVEMIFEDSRRNLWIMSTNNKIKKYDYKNSVWINTSANIIYNGMIFEDSRGNLWAMGYRTKLQKYNYSTNSWSNAGENNNITDGDWGIMFEDSRGNLWTTGAKAALQKYDYSSNNWVATTGNNITNGRGGVIFEDSQGNLWSMGNGTPLQKYNYDTNSWEIADGSNVTIGSGGIIFEDSRGNLWIISIDNKLIKYDYKTKVWSGTNGDNISDGYQGTIFEDSRGNLWSMGYNTPLQKLTSQVVSNVSDQKTKNFNITFTTRINADGRIAVLIKGYRKYTSNKFTHLKYRKKNESDWKIVKNKIMILDSADYEFEWEIGSDERIASDSRMPISFEVKNDGSIKENIITTNLAKELFSIVGTNGNGTIKTQSSDLPSQVETRYYVGLTSSSNNSDYKSKIPIKLSNGKKVWIKFFIKNEYINTHQFPIDFNNNTPIEITVADLPEGTPVVIINLKKESFSITGLNGAGTIKLKKGIILPSQIEVKYYDGTSSNPNNNEYSNRVPNKLSNGKKVWIKFFIKVQNINTHKFPNNFANTPIEITVSGLNNKSSNKENSGATIGIIVGSIVGTLTLGILAYYLIRSKKKKTK